MLSDKFTYGIELEWVDCDARTPIPSKLGSWNFLDFTMVNSDGVAVDPRLIITTKGAEINTRPTNSIEEQIFIIKELISLLPDATTNYRCLTHIHVGVKNLENDIDGLIKIFQYIQDNQDFVFDVILKKDPIAWEDFPSKVDFKMARLYNFRLFNWCKKKTDPEKVIKILQSPTVQEFSRRHYDSNHEQFNSLRMRAGINIMSVFKHKTVEFRCFPGTMDLEEYRNCYEFADAFTRAALFDHSMTAEKIWNSREWKFPKWEKFDRNLERGFLKTRRMIRQRAIDYDLPTMFDTNE